MPEIPDLEGYRAYFNRRLPGLKVAQAQVIIPIVVRAAKEEFAAALTGNTFAEVERRGKYLLFSFQSGHPGRAGWLVVHPMLSGRFQYCPAQEKRRAKTAFVLALDNGYELRYFDERLMGKAYLAREGEFAAKVPRWSEMGPDALGKELTEEAFRQRLKAYRGQIKNVLLTEQCLAGIGNAYADEILWAAGIHPYRKRTELSPEEEGRLYKAIRSVLQEAQSIVTERMEREGLPVDEYRDHIRVHRRGGQPCPNCGNRITEITAGQRITSFCRQCQK